MKPDRKNLELISQRTGFQVSALEKVFRLTEILNDVFRHPVLSKELVLKGGTALNLFYGPPRRLSISVHRSLIAHS